MPRAKKTDMITPANQQKGKKKCTCCGEEKSLVSGFYISKSPLFQIDGRLNICKTCIINMSLNDDGSINEIEFNKILRKTEKPYYKNYLEAAYNQFRKEHSYVSEEEIKFHGKEVIQYYFKNLVMRQTVNKSYDDSEKEGFIFQNNNTSKSDQKKIDNKYESLNTDLSICQQEEQKQKTEVQWTKKDKQNMKYAISTIGYDPFDDVGLEDADRKYCFNILAGYCDTDGISEDGHKMQGVIEMTMLYCQCKKITEAMNIELSEKNVDDVKIQKLTSSKSSLLSSIATIAKDNNISSNYNKNSKQGQNSFTSKMKEMSENGFAEIEINLFDIKTSESFKQIDEISNNNIANQLTLDNNEYAEVVKEQRELVQKYGDEIEELKEENRKLKNQIINLESKKR